MEEVLAQQRNAARPVTGGAFLKGVALVLLKLAVAQVAVNLAITLSGVGLLNVVFYIYAVGLMVAFMSRTVAGSAYVLRPQMLSFSKMLGDSTTSVVEIPTKDIVSVRKIAFGERLACSVRRVTVIDAQAAQGMRMRLSYAMSLFSARLARRIAGKQAQKTRGYAVVYMEEGKRQACVFRPDETFLDAFPALYPFVTPLISPEREQAAREELERQRARKTRRSSGKNPDRPAHRRKK